MTTNRDLDRLRALAAQGLSMSRAAKEMGRSIAFARYWAKHAGIVFVTYRGGRRPRSVVPAARPARAART